MDAALFLIEPNDLENLIIDAESVQDVLGSKYLIKSLYLGKTWKIFHQVFHYIATKDNSPLFHVLQGNYVLSERIVDDIVRYNTVVEVAEIQEKLQKWSLDELKKSYQMMVLDENLDTTQNELIVAEFSLIYHDIQAFYREALEKNLAVITVFSPKIRAD